MLLRTKVILGVLLLMNTPLSAQITRQPKDTAACESGKLFFKVAHSFKGSISFQWQMKSLGVWRNLSNNSVFSNTTTDSLVIVMRDTLDARLFRCILDSAGRNVGRTDSAVLTLRAATRITSQPSGNTLCPGSSHTFSVAATGNGTISYRWFKDNNLVSGQTAKDYALTSIVGGNAGTYRCEVSARCGIVNSNNAVLTVQAATQITAQPGSITRCEGDSAPFAVTASGLALAYQWRKNGSNITGRTARTLSLLNIGLADAADYDVVVSGTCGSVTSSAAKLTVNTKPTVNAQPRDTSICPSLPVTFSLAAAGTGLTYQWQVNSGSGWTNITAAGSSPVYSGWNTAALTLSSPQAAQDLFMYRCLVSGTCAPAVTSGSARLTLLKPPVITGQPSGIRLCEKGSGTFAVTATGTGLRYQWQRDSMGSWRDIRSGGSPMVFSNWTTSSLGVSNVQQANAGNQFRCMVSGTCAPQVPSTAVRLSIDTLPFIISNPANRQVCEGNSTSFSVTARGSGLSYRWQVFNGSTWSDITQQGSNPQFQDWNTRTLVVSGVVSWNNGYRFRCIIQGNCIPGDTSTEATLSVFTRIAVIAQPANNSVCEGTDVQYSTLSTGSALQYNWQRWKGGVWQAVNPATDGQNFVGEKTATLSIRNTELALNGMTLRCRIFNNVCPDVFSGMAVLNVNPNPVVRLQQDTGICRGDSLQVRSIISSGTGKISVEWIPSVGMNDPYAPGAIFKPYAGAQYILSARDSLNCRGRDTMRISVYDLPNGTVDAYKEICIGDNAQMNAGGGISYKWQPNTGLSNPNVPTPLASPTSTTRYTVTIISREGCSVQRNTEVRVYAKPVLITSRDTSVCRGAGLTLFASGAASYTWSPAGMVNYVTVSNPQVNTTASRMYTVEGKSSFGCISTAQVRLTVLSLPNVQVTPDTQVCEKGSLKLFAAGGSQYRWFPTAGLNNSGIASPTATPAATTRYKITVTNAAGCSRDSSVLVSVRSNPSPRIQGINQLCKGDSGLLTFQAAPGITGQDWTPKGVLLSPTLGSALVFPQTSTTIRVQVQDGWGCKGNDSFVMKIYNKPAPRISGNTLVCKNASMLSYTAGSSSNLVKWAIRNGNFAQTPWGNQVLVHWLSGNNGTLYVQESLKDAPYCAGRDSLPVTFRNESAPTAPQIMAEGGNMKSGILVSPMLKAKYIQWGYEDKQDRVEKPTCKNIIWCHFGYIDTLYRYYWVKAGDDSVCTTKSYLRAPRITNTNNPEKALHGLNIYPNPVKDIRTLTISSDEQLLSLCIYNTTGKLVFSEYDIKNEAYFVPQHLNLPPGVYVFTIRTVSGMRNEKVIIAASAM